MKRHALFRNHKWHRSDWGFGRIQVRKTTTSVFRETLLVAWMKDSCEQGAEERASQDVGDKHLIFCLSNSESISDMQWRTSLRDLLTLLGNSEAGCRPCEGSLDGGVPSARARTCPWGCYWSDRAPARCCSSLQKEWLQEAFPVCLQMRSGTSGCDDKTQQNPADKPEA